MRWRVCEHAKHFLLGALSTRRAPASLGGGIHRAEKDQIRCSFQTGLPVCWHR